MRQPLISFDGAALPYHMKGMMQTLVEPHAACTALGWRYEADKGMLYPSTAEKQAQADINIEVLQRITTQMVALS